MGREIKFRIRLKCLKITCYNNKSKKFNSKKQHEEDNY